MTWLLQTKAFNDGNPEEFERILKSRGIDYSWVEVAPFNGGYKFVKPSPKWHKLIPHYEEHSFICPEKFFFYGTINGFKQVGANPSWCDFESLKYSEYSYKYHPFMLNDPNRGSFSTTMFAYKNPKAFGKSIQKFIRPDDNEKSFDGEVVCKEKLKEWYDDSHKYNGNLKIPCWIFSTKNVDQEWRVIIANGEAITASQYRLDKSVEIERDLPSGLKSFAEYLAKQYSPESIFCMDIARVGGALKLVEIGSIHTCGLYACDLEPIVDAVERNLK